MKNSLKLFFSISLAIQLSISTLFANTEQHLAQFNISIDTAKNFLMDNLDNPQLIYDTCLRFDVNNDMLAEILQENFPSLTGETVSQYFTTHGYDGDALGFNEPELCIQVISYGLDPSTNECKEYPTPCDIPQGWESCTPLQTPEEQAALRCQTIKDSITAGAFDNVLVSCDDTYAYITSDTYPAHDKMNGITGTNEQIPVPAKNYSSAIKLNPVGTENKTTIDASLGVAINGVPLYDYSSQGELDMENYIYDSNIDTFLLGQLDHCGGHAGRGDDYHYHARPTCMIDALENKTDDTILGWGYDGYPIYDTKNPDGSTIAANELDICNGKEDESFGYRYHMSTNAPYLPLCLRGEIDENTLPRVAPMQGRVSGTPPQGGVDNLIFTENVNGVTRLEYTYQGELYYLQYEPSGEPDCYLFETKTVTENGEITRGEFCR